MAEVSSSFTSDADTVQTLTIMTADGCCRKHPHVRLRETGPDGRTYQRETCPECEREMQDNRERMQLRQEELDKQLAKLQEQEQEAQQNGQKQQQQQQQRGPDDPGSVISGGSNGGMQLMNSSAPNQGPGNGHSRSTLPPVQDTSSSRNGMDHPYGGSHQPPPPQLQQPPPYGGSQTPYGYAPAPSPYATPNPYTGYSPSPYHGGPPPPALPRSTNSASDDASQQQQQQPTPDPHQQSYPPHYPPPHHNPYGMYHPPPPHHNPYGPPPPQQQQQDNFATKLLQQQLESSMAEVRRIGAERDEQKLTVIALQAKVEDFHKSSIELAVTKERLTASQRTEDQLKSQLDERREEMLAEREKANKQLDLEREKNEKLRTQVQDLQLQLQQLQQQLERSQQQVKDSAAAAATAAATAAAAQKELQELQKLRSAPPSEATTISSSGTPPRPNDHPKPPRFDKPRVMPKFSQVSDPSQAIEDSPPDDGSSSDDHGFEKVDTAKVLQQEQQHQLDTIRTRNTAITPTSLTDAAETKAKNVDEKKRQEATIEIAGMLAATEKNLSTDEDDDDSSDDSSDSETSSDGLKENSNGKNGGNPSKGDLQANKIPAVAKAKSEDEDENDEADEFDPNAMPWKGPKFDPNNPDRTSTAFPAKPSDHFQPRFVDPNNSDNDDDDDVQSRNKHGDLDDDEDDDDNNEDPYDDGRSLGNTIASSTYGEDRQKVVNKTLLDPYGDKGVYTGVVLRSTGMPHGLGRMIYEEDGRIYEGDWRHGRWHGYGKASFSNGDSYAGEYKFDQRHGRGVYRWHDGRVYDGMFSEDKRHGKGNFIWPDGAVYDGEFVSGQREGHGSYTFSDGGQYDGSWKNGKYDGYGTCTWEDGRKYRGEWKYGMAHGKGTETYPNGEIRHEGQWIEDEPVR